MGCWVIGLLLASSLLPSLSSVVIGVVVVACCRLRLSLVVVSHPVCPRWCCSLSVSSSSILSTYFAVPGGSRRLDGVVESSCVTLGFSVGLDVVDDLLGVEVGVRLENFQLAWMSLALYLGWEWVLHLVVQWVWMSWVIYLSWKWALH
jgi:hypothetical protein